MCIGFHQNSTKWLVLAWILAFCLIIEMHRAKYHQKTILGGYSDEEICAAIYKEEGGERTRFPYGISKKFCTNKTDCKEVCIKTVQRSRRLFDSSQGLVFIEMLAKRYCPENQKTWIKNVEYFLNK